MSKHDVLNLKSNCSSGAIIFAVGNLAFCSGLFLQNGGAVALGIVLILAPTIVYLSLRRSANHVQLSQSAPDHAFEGDVVTVKVTLRNHSRRSIRHPRFSEIFAPEDSSQKNIVFPARVFPGEEIEKSYQARCLSPRGNYRYGPSAVRISDAFGWFEIQAQLDLFATIKVYPRVIDAGFDRRLAGAARHALAEILRAGPGESNEFWTMRDYRSGDSPRRIHWPTSARRGDLVVRENARPGSSDLAILLDTYRGVPGNRRRHGEFENAIRIAATLVRDALRSQRRVELYSQRGAIGGGHSESDLRSWLDRLVPLEPSEEVSLGEALSGPSLQMEDASLIVVMVHGVSRDDPKLLPNLARWSHAGRRVIVLMFLNRSADDARSAAAFEHSARRQMIEVYRIPPGRLDGESLEASA